MGEISIREFRREDVPAVLEVLRSALGETAVLKRTPELWRWKHEDNPFGPSLVLLAEDDGRIAGVRAMMRWDLETLSGDTIRALRPVDTATHPEFERRGIFRSLTEAAIDLATERDIDLIFNTPNQASGPGYLKMGWGQVGPIGVMVRPLIRRGRPVPEDQPPDPASYFAADVAAPSGPLTDRPARGLRTPRSEAYVRWRYSGHPTARYVAVSSGGSTAILRPNLRSGRKELVVSDLYGDSPARAIRSSARRARARYLAAWFSPGSPERRASVAAGLLPVPGVRALTLVARPLRELPVDVMSLDAWDIGLGDLELL